MTTCLASPCARRAARLLAGTALGSGILIGAAPPALAACDGNTAGVSVCSGADATITKNATGNLELQFINQTVTTGGVSFEGIGPYDLGFNVLAAAPGNTITNVAGTGVTVRSFGGLITFSTIPNADISSSTRGVILWANTSVVGTLGSTITAGQIGVLTDGTTATLTNNGSITAGSEGINALNGPLTLTNNGGITATNDGAHATNGNLVVTNNAGGTIQSLTGTALWAFGNAAVTNSGTVLGTFGISGANTSIINNSGGLIQSTNSNIGGSGSATLTNAGTVASTAGRAVESLGTVNITNLAGGTISGGNDAVIGASVTVTNAAGASVQATAGDALRSVVQGVTLTNAGAVTAGDAAVNATTAASITNQASGTIAGNLIGITGATVSVTNAGTITGTATAGIEALGSGTVSNDAGGSVSGDVGIMFGAGASTVFNAGTLAGTGGTAIQFAGAGNSLTVAPGFAITGNVLGGGADLLRLGGTGTASFDAGEIGSKYQNFTDFQKLGASVWTLSGTNASALPWDVQQGTLNVTGTVANSSFTVGPATLSVDGTVGAVTLNSGATLMGTGTLGSLAAGSGSIVAPGPSIGTLNVAGPVSFAAGSGYLVEITTAGASDRIAATGAATLSGGTVHVLANGIPSPGTVYTILTAANVTGQFASLTDSFGSALLTPQLSYTPTAVLLQYALVPFSGLAQTPNQAAVAGALQADLGGALAAAVFGIANPDDVRRAYDALSGEMHASLGGVLISETWLMRSALLARLRGIGQEDTFGTGGLTLAYAEPETGLAQFPMKASRVLPQPGPVWWAQSIGAWGHVDSDGNAAAVRRQLGSVIAGVDAPVGGVWRAGVAGGYGQAAVSVDARASSATVDTAHLALYAAGPLAGFNLRTGVAAALHEIDSSRIVAFPGFFEQERARYNGYSGQLFGEVGYGLTVNDVALEPFAGIAWVWRHTNGFTEAGGLAALTGASATDHVGYSTLGLRLAAPIALEGGVMLVPRASLAWQHAFGDVTPSNTFAFGTGTAFSISGAPIARDAALVDAGADVRVTRNLSIGISYLGQLARDAQDHAVKGKASWVF